MESLTFRPEPFRFAPVEREIDKPNWYSDRGGAVSRGRALQQTSYMNIQVFKRSDGNFQVDFSDPLPKPSTFPYDEVTPTFAVDADVVKRAEMLRAYGYTVTTVKRASDKKWFCRITAVATGGPGLPTSKGPDTGFVFDSEKRAKKRAARLVAVGYGVKVGQLANSKWQVEITNLPTFSGGTKSSSSSTASSTKSSGSSTGSTKTSGATSSSKTTTTAAAPPHKLELINTSDPHMLSDAVVQSFRDFAAQVLALTNVQIDIDIDDTTRALTTKGKPEKASDTFTWHKTGRAIDITQIRDWLIVEEVVGGDTYFRLYLLHQNRKTTTGVTFFPAGTTFHHSPWATVKPTWPFVDITALAAGLGWLRIKAQKGWTKKGSGYNKQEWWHFQKSDGLTWLQALREIHTDSDIMTAVKTVASTNKHSKRLRDEGFADADLKAVFPLVKQGKLEIRCPVGKKAANIVDDVKAVQDALIRGGKLPAGSATGSLDAATQTAINTVQATLGGNDGVIDVGLKLHKELGKL